MTLTAAAFGFWLVLMLQQKQTQTTFTPHYALHILPLPLSCCTTAGEYENPHKA